MSGRPLSDTTYRVLRFLSRYRSTEWGPRAIATAIGITELTARDRLFQALKKGWVERPYRGLYHLTDAGYLRIKRQDLYDREKEAINEPR